MEDDYLRSLREIMNGAQAREERSGMEKAARSVRVMYEAFTAQGFTEEQALTLTIEFLKLSAGKGGGEA